MIKNIIFDFDGVLVDSEALIAKSFSEYLAKKNIVFTEKQFYEYAGKKTVQIVSELSTIYNISDSQIFYEDILKISNQLYENDLKPIKGAKEFLEKTNHNRYIGSNNIHRKIINGLKKIKFNDYFNQSSIYSFDLIQKPKPLPDIFLKPFEQDNIKKNETIIIEDSLVGVKAGVAAGFRVIVITAGSHWHSERSTQEFYEAGVFEVVNSFTEMLKLINKL